MKDLKQYLLDCGYTGPCEDLVLLQWAIRVGASSTFFNDLVNWLESQLNLAVLTKQAHDNIKRLLSMLRQSVLMEPFHSSDAAMNPKEFRLQTLKVLVRQLELRKLPPLLQYPCASKKFSE